MRGGFVADSSVAISWAIPSQASEATTALLEDVAAGTPIVVPVLWPFEVANSLLFLERRKRITTEEAARARRAVLGLSPQIDEEGPRLALDTLGRLAAGQGLSIYDAAYLELAMRRRLPLATRDDALRKAARNSGLRTLP